MSVHFSLFVFGFALLPALLAPLPESSPQLRGSISVIHSGLIPNFDLRIHGITLFAGLAYAVLIFSHLGPVSNYVIAGALILIIFGLIDNLLGLLSLRRKYRSEIQGGLAHMLLSAIFAAHLGDLLGTAHYALPIWIAVPAALFSLLSILKVMTLLEKTSGKI